MDVSGADSIPDFWGPLAIPLVDSVTLHFPLTAAVLTPSESLAGLESPTVLPCLLYLRRICPDPRQVLCAVVLHDPVFGHMAHTMTVVVGPKGPLSLMIVVIEHSIAYYLVVSPSSLHRLLPDGHDACTYLGTSK